MTLIDESLNVSEANDLPYYERPDLSPYLVHLTKNTRSEDNFSAFDNLVSILRCGQVWGSEKRKGYIKGPHSAACFMDVPFSSLKYVLNANNCDSEHPRYEPFGIVITKKYAYERGCRPVLYLSHQEMDDLGMPDGEKWRGVRFDGVDDRSVNPRSTSRRSALTCIAASAWPREWRRSTPAFPSKPRSAPFTASRPSTTPTGS